MKLKKICLSLLAIGMCIGITGCSTKDTDPTSFDTFIDELPQRFIDEDDMNLEYLFVHPENYGFKETLLQLPYANEEDYKTAIADSKDILASLENFDYDSLNDDQKLTYDILKDNLERSLLTSAYYDLDNSYLGSFVSFQAQLPFLLDEFNFDSKHELDSYFNILQTSVETFHKYVEIEKNRQEKGTGMSKTILDKTIEQCKNFSNTERVYLIDTINAKIDTLEFLSDTEKADAKKKNEELLMNNLVVAYRNTAEELSQLTPDESDLGLANQPDGKEYYEALLKQRTGLDMSVEEVLDYLDKKENEVMFELMAFSNSHPGVLDSVDFESLKYSDFTSVDETLNYLQTQIFGDFPQLDELNYKVSTVDESMKDNFSPAAYLQSRIDSPLTTQESIIINGNYEDSIFLTVAHEGYPGHMYQNVYFKSLQLPTVRYLLDYNGYSEGWATYIESIASTYATTEDKTLIDLYNINTKLTQIYMCQFDIGIHYEGWNRTEFKNQLEEVFGKGSITDEDINEQYNIFLETPTNYLQYYLTGFQFADLQKKTKDALGDEYNAVEFHEVILNTGPSSFAILQNQVDAYIATKK